MKLLASRSTITGVVMATLLLMYSVDIRAQFVRDPQKRQAPKTQAGKEQPAPEKFPGATRKTPEAKPTEKGGVALREIVELYQAKNYTDAMVKANALFGASENAYERSFASQVAASAASQAGDDAKAITYLKQAIQANGLDNNDHYIAMYNLGIIQYKAKQYTDALDTIERLVSETKADTPDYTGLKAATLASLQRPAEAAALYEQIYLRDPTDKKALMNAIGLYQQAKNSTKAGALLSDAYGQGQLTDPAAYRALYVGYVNAGKLEDALKTIDTGLTSGVVKPSKDLVQVYSVIAQTAYDNDNIEMAINSYRRAAAISANGEASLNLAKVLMNEGRLADARAAAKQALAKGVKNPGDANRILGAGHK